MCTSIVYKTADTYFGRNLDLEYSYDETITVMPRKFPLHFREAGSITEHHAIIGVAYVAKDNSKNDYPLYYDAINEKGLGIAGLNFVGNAQFFPIDQTKDNVAPWEFIPWVLAQCSTVDEAERLIQKMSFYNDNFSKKLPVAELHWIVTDSKRSITVESTAAGLMIYNNPIGVLTNNPPFPAQLFQLNNYMPISPKDPKNSFAPQLNLSYYGRGIGTRDLPGGLDSQSRFVRASFHKSHAISAKDELSSISQYFHILHSCDQPRGSDEVKADSFEITVYSSGYNLEKGICYYTTYDNHQISAIEMHKTKLNSAKLISYPMIETEQINYQTKNRIKHF